MDSGGITGRGLPCQLAPLLGRCPICDASRATKRRRGPLVDTAELPSGTHFHINFTFYNKKSCRGSTMALVIVKATTRYMLFFPTRHKRAHIDLCLFFFNHLRRQGFSACQLCSDGGSALVGSTEFCHIMYQSLGTLCIFH